jgi:hypothetical protein
MYVDFSWLDSFSFTFKGFQTTRINGVKHTAHAMRLSMGADGVVLQYKDLDVPGAWSGHFLTNQPLQVFKRQHPPLHCLITSVLPRFQIFLEPIKGKVNAMHALIQRRS